MKVAAIQASAVPALSYLSASEVASAWQLQYQGSSDGNIWFTYLKASCSLQSLFNRAGRQLWGMRHLSDWLACNGLVQPLQQSHCSAAIRMDVTAPKWLAWECSQFLVSGSVFP